MRLGIALVALVVCAPAVARDNGQCENYIAPGGV
jgi:hypothetical protein